MMQVDVKKCTGCGQCLDICPVGAISLLKGKAVIAPDTCIFCGACVYACPRAAISETRLPETAIQPVKAQPVSIETSKPAPAVQPAGRFAWAMPVITFVGKEILPRLADSVLASLDRRLSTLPKDERPLAVGKTNPVRGQGRQAHRRRRGRNA